MSVVAHRQLLLLCGLAAVTSTATTMLVLAVPLLALEFGLNATGVGFVVSSAYVMPLLLAIPFGRLVDRLGARSVLIAGLCLFGAALVPAILAPGLRTLVLAYVVATLGQLAAVVSSQTVVGDVGKGTGRETAYGWWTTSVATGQFIGPLVAGILLDSANRNLVFVAPALCVFLALALAPFVRRRTSVGDTAIAASLTRSGGVRNALADRVVIMAILTSSGGLWAMAVFSTFLPVRLVELNVSATTIGALMALRAVASIGVRPFMAQAVRAIGGRERTVVMTLVALGAGLIALGWFDSTIAFVLICVFMGVASGLSQPVSMVMVADRIAPRLRGTVLGLRLTGNRLAQLLAPIAFLFVIDALGLGWMFTAHGLIVLVGALALLMLIRRVGLGELENGARE